MRGRGTTPLGTARCPSRDIYGNVVANSILLFKQLGVHFLYESPGTSLLFEYPAVKDALEAVGGVQIKMNMGWMGAHTLKPTLLVGDCLWLQELGNLAALRPFMSNMDGRKLWKQNANGRINGNHQLLTDSAAWPAYFCRTVVDYHIGWTKRKLAFIKLLQVEPVVKHKLGGDSVMATIISAYVSLEFP